MNIFVLDKDDLDLNAAYHIDPHTGKMQLEAAQMLCTNHWIDRYLGYVPRKLTSEEWSVLKEAKTSNEVRDFPYLPTMYNHPVQFGRENPSKTTSGSSAMPTPSTKSICIVEAQTINPLEKLSQNYQIQIISQAGGLLPLPRQCQMNSKATTP